MMMVMSDDVLTFYLTTYDVYILASTMYMINTSNFICQLKVNEHKVELKYVFILIAD